MDVGPLPESVIAVRQIGHATSSSVAAGGWLHACRRCGGVVGAVAGIVSAELEWARGVVFSRLSEAGVAEVRSMAGGAPTFCSTVQAEGHGKSKPESQEHGKTKSSAESPPTAGFTLVVGCPCPPFFFLGLSRLQFFFLVLAPVKQGTVFILASFQMCQWRSVF